MNYRTVYNDTKVVTSVEDSNNTVTSSNKNFIIDTPANAARQLAKQGINPSYLWKNGIIATKEPVRPSEIEVDISNHPTYTQIQRKAFVMALSFDLSDGEIKFNLLIRHFLADQWVSGNLVTQQVPMTTELANQFPIVWDEYYSDVITNENAVFNVVKNSSNTLLEQMITRIATLDANGTLNNIYE